MPIRVNPKLVTELERYGAEDVQKCYHCGNCSAVCVHSDALYTFPRKSMRQLQMGLERRILTSLDPWLCYYCGQCSTQCPRGAEPGATMMSLRRWLTARYDFTGISRLFYRSWKAELVAIVLLGLAAGLGFLAWGLSHGDLAIYDGPGAFLDSSLIHVFDWALAAVLSAFLGINALRMWWFTVGCDKSLKVSFGSYLRKLVLLPLHFFTQRRYARCEKKQPWLIHLALMVSYVTMLVLIMFFVRSMQAGPAINWSVHAFGYLASLGLVTALVWFIGARVRQTEPHVQHSHESDWIFLVMLLLVTITGMAQHVLHRVGVDEAANVAYVIHLMAVVPMLALEVPFSKWSHMAYRPLAMYLAEVRRDALIRRDAAATAKSNLVPNAA
jgi:quinone-modifying oxidoreductase, subunit QmoC